MNQAKRKIQLSDLKSFCCHALMKAGMTEEFARITAEVLAETDAYGTHSHGTVNLGGYINKARVGGLDIAAEPVIVKEGPAFAIMDAQDSMGMVPSYKAMELACEKARETGIALVTVKNSTHFGAAGYYANMAARSGMLGLSMSNVDPNMTAPGARGMVIGNNPVSYAAPASLTPTISLDIALSNVASLKVVKARKEGKSIPDTWVVDKDGLPTTDPSHYPEEGAVQPMSSHKGYGLAVMVELMTGALSGGGMSPVGDIVSWLFEPEAKNNVSHTFIAIDIEQFVGKEAFIDRADAMAKALRGAPKAKGSDRIYTPGEMEWNNHQKAQDGLELPLNVVDSLVKMGSELGLDINWMEDEES